MHTCKIILFVFASVVLFSCKKNWIKDKSNKALDVPNATADFQALMDNSIIMNDGRPAIGEVGADNYYIPNTSVWQTFSTYNQNAAIWEKDIYNSTLTDNVNWNNSYRAVFYANVVLDDIDKVASGELNSAAWKNVKGSACFYRGEAFFNIAQLFAKPYSLTFPDYPGIPLRLNADPNSISVRSNLQDTYNQILNDLQAAADLLPATPLYKTRPSKPAAYALLARYYLVKQDYVNALKYADQCLKLYDSLLDYNTLNASANFPVPALNKEVIFEATLADNLYNTPAFSVYVDSGLYKSYDDNDLRKKMFFKVNTTGQAIFCGFYTGGSAGSLKTFGGIATDEVYFIRAECYARAGKITEAMNDLNTVMATRWSTGKFVPFTAANTGDALALVLTERRKETLYRGLRWPDLRRLNSEGASITLYRTINGRQYTLPPNDPRYVLPIPPDIIALSGMAQNER